MEGLSMKFHLDDCKFIEYQDSRDFFRHPYHRRHESQLAVLWRSASLSSLEEGQELFLTSSPSRLQIQTAGSSPCSKPCPHTEASALSGTKLISRTLQAWLTKLGLAGGGSEVEQRWAPLLVHIERGTLCHYC